jgi:hypothetical protein
MRRGLALTLLVVAAACGGDDGSGDDDGTGGPDAAPPPGPITDLGPRIRAARCHWLYTCCNADERAVEEAQWGFTDEASCVMKAPAADFASAVALGTVELTNQGAEACAAAVEALDCDGWRAADEPDVDVPACAGAITGTVPNYQGCTASSQCASKVCTDGSCQDPPDLGEPCTEVCAEGLVCLYNDMAMLVCQPGPPPDPTVCDGM